MKIAENGDVHLGQQFFSRDYLPLPENMNNRLAVDGQIVAKNFLIRTTGWADYVFDDHYSLMPLSELELFVKKNKHLPEVPTEEEVNKKGIDVAAVQATLLKKVEELTLYMIDLEKKNDKLQQRINALERKH